MLAFVKSLFTTTVPLEQPEEENDSNSSTSSNDSDVEEITADKENRGAAASLPSAKSRDVFGEGVNDDNMQLRDDKQQPELSIRLDQLCSVRQHLEDCFQFLVKIHKDGGEEYGLQLESAAKALVFRQQMAVSLLKLCEVVVEVECAVAEYDMDGKEFVILSKSAKSRIMRRPSDDEYYFVISNTVATAGETSDDDSNDGESFQEVPIFVDYLSKELQVWPSPMNNQITFWGIHHQRSDITNVMFLMEMDPGKVTAGTILRLFSTLASVLNDKNFLNEEQRGCISGKTTTMKDEDDGFEIGPLGDVSTHKEWRRHRRSSVVSADASSDEDDSDDATDAHKYLPDTYPMYSAAPSKDSLVHRFMEVGSERTFVCRGETSSSGFYGNRAAGGKLQMKVYRREEDDGEDVLETVGTIDGKKFFYKGENFTPSKGLLHQQEKKLLMVPENRSEDIYMMDLEAETVVQKWDANGTAIDTLFPSFKKGQASHDPTFLCTNPRNLFMMDARTVTGSAKTMDYSYATNPQLSVGASDEAGHILLGSRLGELRLFDGEQSTTTGGFKRAKTLLQSIREPITAVDVTADGSWIVATTRGFLVVFPTRLAGTGGTGFEVGLGQHKPAPRYLMLSADDLVKYQITDINFAPARFDAEEDSIVTSTGNMAVVWDFGTVKRGKPFYSVRFAEDAIKDVQIAADSANVVVAYPTAVGLFGTEKRKASS